MMTITLTEEQMMMVRQAMCNASMKYLTKAFETEDELKNLGRTGEEVFEYSLHNECQKIISIIDSAKEY